MANLDTQEQDENNLAQYRQIKQQTVSLVSQLTAFQGTFTTLRANVSAESQAILDAKRTAFISQLQAALGI
jgi:hypothetical protein